MAINQDEWIIDPARPKGDALVSMMNRKAVNAANAYRSACFWAELQTVNPHYADLCTQQVKVQWGWAQANAGECAELQKTLQAEGRDRADLVETAQWWATECTTLLAECEGYDPAHAPAWAQKRISAIDSRLVDSGRANGWLVGNCPAVGFYIMLHGGSAPQWVVGDPPINVAEDQLARLAEWAHDVHDWIKEGEDTEQVKEVVGAVGLCANCGADFIPTEEWHHVCANCAPAGYNNEPSGPRLQPLDIVEDRTEQQKLEDGDLPAPTHCKSCGAELQLKEGRAPYLWCSNCSDPARYYVVSYGGKVFLKPKKGKKQ
jgi:hypothetical protein